jgi:transposase-like protein
MGKYREYAAEFKVRVVLEALRGQKSQAEICRSMASLPICCVAGAIPF